ncbi:hypothetical protein ACIPY5_20000 [Microbacterium sp. NPDC089698]|uniref:hypothetical protein n=1 Tax=Microbacterium sp. NPDC089698 TaxID=3364200 RepID=UPI0038033F5D
MKKTERVWMDADTAMWHICRIAYEIETGTSTSAAPIATMFPLHVGESAHAAGPLIVDEFRQTGMVRISARPSSPVEQGSSGWRFSPRRQGRPLRETRVAELRLRRPLRWRGGHGHEAK